MESKDLVLYDFCGTLVDFQTANAYVNYVISRKGLKKNMTDYARSIFNRLHLMPLLNRFHKRMSVNKSMLLYRLKGSSYQEMDAYAREFYEACIKPHLVQPIVTRLRNDIESGKVVAIVSGGYDIYIKYFAAEYNVPNLLSTSLLFENGEFSGHIKKCDCMGCEKVRRLSDYFHTENVLNVFGEVTGYSDSESDLPMLLACSRRVVVLQNNSIPDWAGRIGAGVIINDC